MQFKVIDSRRINIYLTSTELETEKINLNRIDEADFLKERLYDIFDRVGKESGFKVLNSPLEVEIIPILDGDLLISVKKMELRCIHFVFDDIEDVISICKMLHASYSGRSDLYFYNGKYHMMLNVEDEDLFIKNLMCEFGKEARLDENVRECVLKEHGKVICEQNCVELFTKVF